MVGVYLMGWISNIAGEDLWYRGWMLPGSLLISYAVQRRGKTWMSIIWYRLSRHGATSNPIASST